MAGSLTPTILCPVLIGRELQLAALTSLIAQVETGQGQLALIAGEAGIGKSRLVAEVSAQATRRGFTLLQGRCFEPDRALPYAPLLDLLRTQLGTQPWEVVSTALGLPAQQLVSLLPEFTLLPPDQEPAPALNPAQEQRRIAQAFVQFFTHWAARTPLLVVIEDLHWSDDTSLEVLLTVARRVVPLPILLLLTYRDDEVRPALAQMLATLERERRAHEFRLARLAYAEIDALVQAIFQQRWPIRSDFLAALYTLTEGNPFFVEEILKALVVRGDIFYAQGQWDRKPLSDLNIPRTVQVAVRQRAELLPPPARRLLTLAAVAGRRFDFDLLQRVTGHDEGTLIELIKALIAAQLVVEESAETFAFRHALTREALYADLLARERKALHGTIAAALEDLAQARAVQEADLSYHFFAAEQWPKALEYARRAAEHAQRLYAPRAAIEHLARAVAAAQWLTLPVPAALYRARGQMHELLGEFERAHDDYQAALDSAVALDDLRERWQALLALGLLWAARDYMRMGDYLHQALDLARTIGDPLTLGHSLNRAGNWHLILEQPWEALRYHQEALDLFQAAGDQRGLALTYDLLGVTSMMAGDIPAGVAHYEQAVTRLRELGERQGLSSSLATLSMRGASYVWRATVWPPTDPAACIRDGDEARRIAQQIDWRAGEANALIYLAFGHGPRGEYAAALERAQAALDIAREIEHTVWLVGAHSALGAIALDLLALDQARDHLERAFALAQGLGTFFVRNIAGLLGPTCIAQRDFARAEAVLATSDPDPPMAMQGQRSLWCARAELLLARHDPALALPIIERLIASAPHAEHAGAGCIPRLWHLRGEALADTVQVAEAEAALVAAEEGARRLGLPPIRWRIQCSLGRLYQAQGRRKQAEAAFAGARAIVEALAAGVPDSDLRAAFLRATALLIPRPPPPTPRRVTKQAYAGLTAREREIAARIAQGQANREIAAALVLSEHTVARHVSNILAKLNVASRAQIAAWAADKGLTTPQ